MVAWWFLIGLAVVFAMVWINLARRPGPKARLGPDGTNVRNPETFVVHHEGKGQGMDIANTALKERTEDVRRDLPGDAHKVKTPVPGRKMVHMTDAPPTDISKYGDEKVAPGATPGQSGAESKAKVLMEGPPGSRPETPEEPGSPYAKGRRVTDNHRDVELAEEVLPNLTPGRGGMDRDQAFSPSTNGMEPGYGLGRTAPGETDGEGGPGRGKVVLFRRSADHETGEEIAFNPDPSWAEAAPPERDWSALQEDIPLPEDYGEDAVVAMVRNPRSLYVYWEAGGFGDENLQAMLSDAEWQATRPVLRVFDVTSGAYPGQAGGHTFEIEVSEQDDHWFVNEGIEPGHRYVVSLERRAQDHQYYMISHSGPVSVPNDGPAAGSELYRLQGRQPGEWSGSPWR
jgi:hypothetical protein